MSLTQEQLAMRLTGIGGSEIAAIAGVSPYATSIDVFMVKHKLSTFTGNFNTERGTFFEPAIANWYIHRTGRTLTYPGTVRHPTDAIVLATPDGIADQDILIEIKSPGEHTEKLWGPPGTEHIPPWIRMQAIWGMAVTGLKKADVVADIKRDLCVYHIEYSERLYKALLEVATSFWHDHVLTGIAPEPDGSNGYRDYLSTMFPEPRGDVEDDDSEELQTLIADYRRAEGASKQALLEKEASRQRLTRYVGERGGIRGDYGAIYFRKNKDGEKVDYKSLIAGEGIARETVAKYTTITSGSRVLRPYLKSM